MMKRRKHSAETKAKAVLDALKEDQTIAEVASKYDVHPKLLAQWKQEFQENASLVFNRKNQEKRLQEDLKEKYETIDSLYKEVGQLTLKVNWAQKKISEFGL